jgi:predicted  nucleic acid-binding Zn-ribbon protein
MSKLWDDLKKNMREWSNVAVEKAEEVSKIAVAKTEELTKISRIKIDVHQLQRDLGKLFESLGKMVYHSTKEENVANFTGHKEYYATIEKIDKLKEQIAEKEDKIQEIKEAYDLKEAEITATVEALEEEKETLEVEETSGSEEDTIEDQEEPAKKAPKKKKN